MLVVFSLILFKSVMQSIKKARFIEDMPTSKIRSAPQGYVELEGVAEAIPALQMVAPLTHRPCCWYSYQVEELVTRRVGQRQESAWEVLVGGTSPHLFLLQDGTGKSVISPLGAEIKTSHQDSWQSSQLPEHLQRGFGGGNRNYRFSEARIEVADRLYALGHFETIRNLGSLHRPEDFKPLQQQSAKKASNRLRFVFLPQNKEITQANQEWADYQKAQQEAKDLPDHINVMRQNPSTRQPYLLSNMSQRALARKYRWQAFWYGMFFIIVVVMFMSLWYFKFDLQLPFMTQAWS